MLKTGETLSKFQLPGANHLVMAAFQIILKKINSEIGIYSVTHKILFAVLQLAVITVKAHHICFFIVNVIAISCLVFF